MKIATPNPDGPDPILKDIQVRGGVKVRFGPGFMSVWGRVTEVNEEAQTVSFSCAEGPQTVPLSSVRDARNPQEQEWQEVYENNISKHG